MARTRAVLALLAILLVGTGVAAAVTGEPVLSATLQTDGVSPGEQTTLDITLLNNGSVETGSVDNPTLTDRVTTARGLKIEIDRKDRVPITVHAGTYAVGSLPEGGQAPLQVPITVDEDAKPGNYRLPINVSYRYTEEIDSAGEEDTEEVRRDLNVTLQIEKSPRFRVHEVSAPIRVGATDTISVTLRNVGRRDARDARVTVSSETRSLTFAGGVEATRYVGYWPKRSNRTVEVEATVDETAAADQNYSMAVQTTYADRYNRTQVSDVRRFALRAGPEQDFAIENTSSTLAVGEDGTLRGTIRNTGTETVSNAVVILTDERATITPLETESPIGNLNPGDTADFSFPLEISEEAEAGLRQFTIDTRYRTADDTLVDGPSLDVSGDVAQERPAFRVSAERATVRRGDTGTLNLTVTNTGGEPYTDISAKLFAESPLSAVDDQAFAAELAPGESTELAFSVAASGAALTKEYPVSLDFRYDDADGDTKTSDTVRQAVTVVKPPERSGPSPLLIGGAVIIILIVIGGAWWLRR
ncbi:MAG: COG1361 S-layer family protein [Salinirussus sp.]